MTTEAGARWSAMCRAPARPVLILSPEEEARSLARFREVLAAYRRGELRPRPPFLILREHVGDEAAWQWIADQVRLRR